MQPPPETQPAVQVLDKLNNSCALYHSLQNSLHISELHLRGYTGALHVPALVALTQVTTYANTLGLSKGKH